MNICVLASAQNVPEKYIGAAKEFGALIGSHGHSLVWGGSNRGLMKAVADGAEQKGAPLIAISIEMFLHKVRQGVRDMYVAKTLSERKEVMLARSNALAVLPGGIGTLDEATEVLAHKRHGAHNQPVVFLNIDGFYDGFKEQLDAMEREGFFANLDNDAVEGLESLAFFADTPEEAMHYIEAHVSKV